jgi:ribokinase
MIYVVGPVAFDTVIYCADFPAPNSAVPITGLHSVYGGPAGNAAAVLAGLGAQVSLVTAVGRDFAGSDYERHLKSLGVRLEHAKAFRGELTSRAFMPVTDRGEMQSFFYWGASRRIRGMSPPKLARGRGDYVHVATGDPKFNRKLAGAYAGKRVSFDPGCDVPLYSRRDLEFIFGRIGILSMNEFEMKAILAKLGEEDARSLLGYGMEAVLVTMGAKGSEIHLPGGSFRVRAFEKAARVDPTGAGDSYRAGFICGLSRGLPVEECAKIGSSVASFVIGHVGGQGEIHSWEKVAARAREL